MAGRLEGRVAIVTGASRGIGEAIATAFAAEGAKVVVASRKPEGVEAAAARINEAHPGAAHPRACHVGHADEIRALVAWAEETLGLPTILVNNAATNPYFGPLLGTPDGAWDKTFEVNLKGPFAATREVVRRLVAAGRGGSIVNVASVVGMGAAPMQGCYAMTKAALISMTQTFAFELGGAGIRVNAIAPGLVDTRFASALTGNPEMTAWFNEKTALRRVAQPEEIAGMAVFLASDEASFVTAQVFPVDAGFTAG